MHRHLMDLGEALHDAPVAALKEAFVATDLEVRFCGLCVWGGWGSEKMEAPS